MDVNRAFNTPFQDQEWAKKAAFGGLWMMLFFTSPFLYGYWLDYVRNVANGRDLPLPEWGDYGRLWVRGFLLSLAFFIYMLPAVILFAIGFAPLIGAMISGASEDVAAAAGLTICLFGFLAFAWTIAVSVITYAALVNYSMREEFGSLFAFGEIIGHVKRPGYFQTWLMSIVIWVAAGFAASAVSGILGGILPVIGSLAGFFVTGFAYYLAIVMSGHLLGQWAAGVYGTPGLGGGGTVSATPPPGMPSQPPAPPAAPAPPAPPAEPAVPPPPAMPPEPPAEERPDE